MTATRSPIVSIIVPVYRTPPSLLRRFLASALGQTLTRIELIAVDDASPDACPRILDETAAGEPRMTVIHLASNGRAGMARNAGMDIASGDFLLFADADDYMQPDLCRRLVELARQSGADIVAASWATIGPDGRAMTHTCLPSRRYDLTSPRQLARCCANLNYALWNKLFGRATISTLRFEQFDANIGEDTLFNFEAVCRSRVMLTTPYAGYAYTRHAASATGRAERGLPYLRTLADSGERIRQTLAGAGSASSLRRSADRVALKRFATGCDWIAACRSASEREALWGFWREHLQVELAPRLYQRSALAVACLAASRYLDAGQVARVVRRVAGLTDGRAMWDRIGSPLRVRRGRGADVAGVCPPAGSGHRVQ